MVNPRPGAEGLRPKAIIAKHTTEAEFQRDVVALALAHGWLVHHCRPARTVKGWATPIQGTPGFPDLVLVRVDDLFFVEVKAEDGRLSRQQAIWIKTLEAIGLSGHNEYRFFTEVWRPSDWDRICQILE